MNTTYLVAGVAVVSFLVTFGVLEAKPSTMMSKAIHQDYYCQAEGMKNSYDSIYRASVREFYPTRFNTHDEWCWLKCQAEIESGQRGDAVSPVGAEGVLQLTPPAIEDVVNAYGINVDARNERENITAAAAYMSILFKKFNADRNKKCHREVTQAANNCGFGCFLKAQIRAGGANCMPEIEHELPKETRGYPHKIAMCHAKMNRSM